jgi:peptide/nickel transport system substrate-binding protein
MYMAYTRLFGVRLEYKAELLLVSDYEVSDDLQTWTFTLDDTFKFNHPDFAGETVTAEDVKATFDAVHDDDVGSPGQGEYGPLDSVDAVDETTVRFNMSEPFGDLDKVLTRRYGPIFPKELYENDELGRMAEESFGSGPFRLESFESGSQITLVKSEHYNRTDEEGTPLPYLDKVTIRIIPEPLSRTNALQNEDVDMLNLVPPDQAQRVQNLQGVNFQQAEDGITQFPLIMRADTEPFDDVRVRQAVKYAIDSNEILQSVGNGYGVLGYGMPLSPGQEFYPSDLAGDSYEFGPEAKPDEAERLLAEAGYEDGIDLDFPLWVTPNRTEIPRSGVLMQDQLSDVGINFEVQQASWDTFLSDVETSEPFYISYYNIDPAEFTSVGEVALPDGAYYGLAWDNQEFIDAVKGSLETVDDQEKAELWRTAMQIMQEEGPLVVPYLKTGLGAVQNYVENYRKHPMEGEQANIMDTIYLDN